MKASIKLTDCLLLLFICLAGCGKHNELAPSFDAERAMADIQTQLQFGARYPGSLGHAALREYMQSVLTDQQWDLSWQVDTQTDQPIFNLEATLSNESEFWLLLGTHYDTRQFADEEMLPADQQKPVPGANDGASGTAILLELARVLPQDLNCQISLVFFDAEDQGRIADRAWSEGARAYVSTLTRLPDEVIIIDMVGDKELNIYRERNSDPDLTDRIWQLAHSLGFQHAFIDEPGYAMIDDHLPFIERGVPTSLLIDFDYPTWHTLNDDLDQVSVESLHSVGATLLTFILSHPHCAHSTSLP